MAPLILLVFLLPALLISAPAYGQEEPSERLAILLSELRDGTTVRITVTGGERREGVILEADRTGLVIDDPAEQVIGADRVESLWVRGKATQTGAIIGAALGTTLGVLAGASLSQVCDTDDCAEPETIVAVGLVGAVAGASVGALFGTLFNKWEPRY